MFGVGFIVLVLVAGIVATFVAQDPLRQDLDHILQGPTLRHWLGTDDLGRDVFSRLLGGGLVSLRASCIAVGVALVIGVPLGLLAGFRGGVVDEVVMRCADTVLAFPGLVLAVGVVAMLGPGLTNAMIAVGIVFAPSLARLMRAQVLGVKERLYVEAATTFGSSTGQIVKRHIIPNAVQPVIVQTSLLFALGLLAEAGLSFIGLGVQPPDPSWGTMLGRAYRFMRKAPLQMIAPGIAIVLSALSFNILGDARAASSTPNSAADRDATAPLPKGTLPCPPSSTPSKVPSPAYTLNRPRRAQRDERELGLGVGSAAGRRGGRPQVRSILLDAEGRAFSPAPTSRTPTPTARSTSSPTWPPPPAAPTGSGCAEAVVAAVQGWCVGAGVEMAISADVTIAADDATFFLPQVKLGILPGGRRLRLVRRIGEPWTARMALLGERIKADTALRIGLVTEVVPRDELGARASSSPTRSPTCRRLRCSCGKESINQSYDLPLAAGLMADKYRLFVLSGTPEKEASHAAFRERGSACRRPDGHHCLPDHRSRPTNYAWRTT